MAVESAMHAPGRHTVSFTISGPIRRDDLPGLCNRVGRLLPGAGIAQCDVEGVEPDAVCVDALARLQLAARRRGCCVRLEHASDALLELVALMGLTHVLPAERDPPPFCRDVRAEGAVDG